MIGWGGIGWLSQDVGSLRAPSVLIITKCCGQTILTWRKIVKDKTAPMHLCNKKIVDHKNCRGAEEKNRSKPAKEGQTEMETRTGDQENDNETGPLTWRQFAKDKTAPLHLCNKNCLSDISLNI